jgi:hypothetical protein
MINTLKINKYKNKKIIIDNISFDSKKESEYYLFLKSKEKRGEIKNLELQKKFELQPSFKINNKTIRSITYVADFVYIDNEGLLNVVDVKGFKTQVYLLKKKMFEFMFKIKIQEI